MFSRHGTLQVRGMWDLNRIVEPCAAPRRFGVADTLCESIRRMLASQTRRAAPSPDVRRTGVRNPSTCAGWTVTGGERDGVHCQDIYNRSQRAAEHWNTANQKETGPPPARSTGAGQVVPARPHAEPRTGIGRSGPPRSSARPVDEPNTQQTVRRRSYFWGLYYTARCECVAVTCV